MRKKKFIIRFSSYFPITSSVLGGDSFSGDWLCRDLIKQWEFNHGQNTFLYLLFYNTELIHCLSAIFFT